MAPQTAPTRASQTRARERARLQLAEKQAAARAREKANEADLVAFFTASELLDAAGRSRDEAVTAARLAFDDAAAAARDAQAARLRSMADRGESVEDLAELSGLTATEVRRALRSAPTPEAEPADATHDITGTPNPTASERPDDRSDEGSDAEHG